jgi:hypothetical protein
VAHNSDLLRCIPNLVILSFLFGFNFWWACALSTDGMVICSSVILCITLHNKGVYSVQTQITLTVKNTSHPKQHIEHLMKQLTVILWSFLLITKADVILIASVRSAWSVFWRAHDLKFCKTAILLVFDCIIPPADYAEDPPRDHTSNSFCISRWPLIITITYLSIIILRERIKCFKPILKTHLINISLALKAWWYNL